VCLGMLTAQAFQYVTRLCHHLVLTAAIPLVLAPGPRPIFGGGTTGTSYDVYIDASHGTGPRGRTIGGFVMQVGAGGAFASKCICAPAVDSSGAAELGIATMALKFVLGVNMLLEDLRLGGVPLPELLPVRFLIDASAVIDGVSSEQMKRTTRWLAARKAMLRHALESGVIVLTKIPTGDNVADILTKPLTGAAFARHRFALLGLRLMDPSTRAALSPQLEALVFGFEGA